MLADHLPFIPCIRTKDGDVGAIERPLDTDGSLICADTVDCGEDEFRFRIATPELRSVCVQGADVYICVKDAIAPSFEKTF